MNQPQRSYTREAPAFRRESLIEATLDLIAEQGPEAATVRAIATRAGVTPGLIRHHFATKSELLAAAYEHHMAELIAMSSTASAASGFDSNGAGPSRSPADRLDRFITAALSPPAVDPRAIALWAGFIHMVRRDPRMHAIHARTYVAFRDRLQALIEARLQAAGVRCDAPRLRQLAIACNAVLDGLWLEGGALPEAFRDDDLPALGRASVAAILATELGQGETLP